MRVTANQLTIARLMLLPAPVAMLYRGYALDDPSRTTWLLAALAVYIVLGLTDAVDGMLARRYGSTPVGALLDPIVDKIFVVAVYVPMADLEIAALWMVILLFVRELGVTALRRVALEQGFSFETTRVAKLKTTVQMAGAGFLLLIWLFPGGRIIGPILAAAALGSLVPPLRQTLKGKRPGWRAVSGAVLICYVGALRLALPPRQALTGIMLTITGMTVFSGIQYAWAMREVLRRHCGSTPAELARLAGLALTVPLLFLPALEHLAAPVFAIMAVVAAELALGGLDNALVQAGRPKAAGWDPCRLAVLALLGAIVLVGLRSGGLHMAEAAAWTGAALPTAEFAARLVAHRGALRRA